MHHSTRPVYQGFDGTAAAGTIANWVAEMAAFLKQVDPNHLVTVGEDGFYGCCNAPANPGVMYSEWASDEGQDFLADHASPDIDFATFHGVQSSFASTLAACSTSKQMLGELICADTLHAPVHAKCKRNVIYTLGCGLG